MRHRGGPGRAEIGNILGQPAEVEPPVDAGKDMIIRHKVTQRPADGKLELIPVLMTNHPGSCIKALAHGISEARVFQQPHRAALVMIGTPARGRVTATRPRAAAPPSART